MSERKEGNHTEPKEEDPRKKHRLTIPRATAVASLAGGIWGGLGYGAARLLSSEDIANRVGLGIGLGLGSLMAGVTFDIVAQEEATKLAIQGEVRRAVWKKTKGTIQAAIGCGTSGVAAGFEASGLAGAIIGGTAGATLALGSFSSAKSLRELGIAYRDAIIPIKNPDNFPQYSISRNKDFIEDDLDIFETPVYDAPSIGNLKEFRQAQVEEVTKRSKKLSGAYNVPEVLLARLKSAVFIVPDVSHYPINDPEKDTILFGKFSEPSERIQLDSPDDNLIASPWKDYSRLVWPYPTEFVPNALFKMEQWLYWKEISWKREVVILAQRKVHQREKNSETPSVEDQYYLIDILLDQSEWGLKRRRKKLEEVEEPSPEWQPTPI